MRASFGQSAHDWLRLRFGVLGRVTDGVAFPEHAGEVRELLDWAAAHGVQVLPCGGATSVVGHLTPVGAAPVLTLSTTRMMRLLELDPEALLARFEAGVGGPDLEAQLRAHGHTLGHFPQSFEYSTLGGWIATRSSGQQSARYGRIEQLFAGGHGADAGCRMAVDRLSGIGRGPRPARVGARLGRPHRHHHRGDGARLAAAGGGAVRRRVLSRLGAGSRRGARAGAGAPGPVDAASGQSGRDADDAEDGRPRGGDRRAGKGARVARRRCRQMPAVRRVQRRPERGAGDAASGGGARGARTAASRPGRCSARAGRPGASPASTCATACGMPATRSRRWRRPATGRASTR